jgi:outer membrane protein assembly factor BamB
VIGADAAGGGNIHGFDRASGRMRWKVPAGSGVRGPIAGSVQRAYAATPDAVVSLDVESGAVRWSRALKVPDFEGPAAAMNRVFAGSVDGSVYALNADSGRDEWRMSLGSAVTSSVTPVEGAVYVGTGDGTIYRVDARDGSILSSLKLDDTLKPQSVPVVTGDALLVLLTDKGADYRAIVSLDLSLRHVRWRQDAPKSWSTSRAFVWHNAVVLGTSSGDIIAYCTSDGSRAWSRTVKGSVRAIGGADDMLYVSTSQGSLDAMAPTSSCSGR